MDTNTEVSEPIELIQLKARLTDHTQNHLGPRNQAVFSRGLEFIMPKTLGFGIQLTDLVDYLARKSDLSITLSNMFKAGRFHGNNPNSEFFSDMPIELILRLGNYYTCVEDKCHKYSLDMIDCLYGTPIIGKDDFFDSSFFDSKVSLNFLGIGVLVSKDIPDEVKRICMAYREIKRYVKESK
ncbi:MAG: hypothetical protein ABII01_06600 [Candidatus Woesearchaeota archaeon]